MTGARLPSSWWNAPTRLCPGFYPHPELLLATRWDEAFAEQFACAWQHHATDKTAALRWELGTVS
jgi:hypothetical protein